MLGFLDFKLLFIYFYYVHTICAFPLVYFFGGCRLKQINLEEINIQADVNIKVKEMKHFLSSNDYMTTCSLPVMANIN